MSFRIVLFPEPFGPMRPNASPGATVKLTSRTAHSSSREPFLWNRPTATSWNDRGRSWWMTNLFET